MKQQRRDFLKTAAITGGAALLAPLTTQQAFAQSSLDTSGYKALICIGMPGGNDCHNTVIPYDLNEHKHYKSLRTNIALAYNKLTPITPENGNAQYALHPNLKHLHKLFEEEGKLSIIANVGPMLNEQRKGIKMLNSHVHQRAVWYGLDMKNFVSDRSGWAGRMADLSADIAAASPNGGSLWQQGRFAKADALKAANFNSMTAARQHVMAQLNQVAKEQGNIFEREITRYEEEALASIERINTQLKQPHIQDAMDALPYQFNTSNKLESQFDLIVRAIIGRQTSRQTFFASFGNFDTHSGQLGRHAGEMRTLDSALFKLQKNLDALGLTDSVTTFTTSDFGRTLTSNGSGSDHGWGGHHFVMGGAVQGKQIFGQMPEMNTSSDDYSNKKGTLRPRIATEQYFATLASWFGVPDSLLPSVLPYIDNFSVKDIGFMQG